MSHPITPQLLIAKWKRADLAERAASQEHFIDLCRMLGHPTPAEADPTGEFFTFERGAEKAEGGNGWADVCKRNFFGWGFDCSNNARCIIPRSGSASAPRGSQRCVSCLPYETV